MKSIIRKTIALTALAFLFGCGGGGGGSADSGGIGGTGVTSSGVMTKGSVILNGVRFEDTTANILIDDTPKTAANLKDGMVVQVRGTITQGGNGTAQQIEAQIEVRGVVSTVDTVANPQTFVVLGQTVIVDDQTLFSNLAGVGAVVAGTTVVEVHGLRDAIGRIRATRVEGSLVQLPNGTGMADPLVDEIRGVVTNRASSTDNIFNVGPQVVDATGATVLPAGASFANGSVVEVHCTVRPACVVAGQFQVSRIEVEDAEDSAFQPGMNERFEVEGLVSGFTAHPGNFSVAGVAVGTSGSTRFEGGISTDLGNDVKVEAEGVWNGTTLVASKIEFKRSVVRLQGFVTTQAANTFTLDIAGRPVNVETDDFTDADAPLPANGSATCVQVRGQRKAEGPVVVVAGEIRVDGCGNSNRPVLQAPVEAESGTNLTLLGFPINVGSPTDSPPYEDLNGNPLTQSQFFAAVTPVDPGPPAVAGTLVKVTFDDGGVTVHQVELED
jgi:hypothetical protein